MVLSDQFAHDLTVHIGQAEVATCETVGEPFVIEAQQVQHRGMQVVCGDWILDCFEAELVGGTMDCAPFDPAAGHPH